MLQHHINPNAYDVSRLSNSDFISFADHDAKPLTDSATRIKVPAGKSICDDGETATYCYKILSGTARTVKFTPDGRRQVHAFLTTGDLIGFEADGQYRFSTEAISDCVLLRYSHKAVTSEIDHNAAAARQILKSMTRSLNLMQERLLMRCKTSAAAQVAWFLLQQADQSSSGTRVRVTLPMNRIDIADYLGMATETLSRVLKQFKDDGLIKLESLRSVVILDQYALEDITGTP